MFTITYLLSIGLGHPRVGMKIKRRVLLLSHASWWVVGYLRVSGVHAHTLNLVDMRGAPFTRPPEVTKNNSRLSWNLTFHFHKKEKISHDLETWKKKKLFNFREFGEDSPSRGQKTVTFSKNQFYFTYFRNVAWKFHRKIPKIGSSYSWSRKLLPSADGRWGTKLDDISTRLHGWRVVKLSRSWWANYSAFSIFS